MYLEKIVGHQNFASDLKISEVFVMSRETMFCAFLFVS